MSITKEKNKLSIKRERNKGEGGGYKRVGAARSPQCAAEYKVLFSKFMIVNKF